MKALLIKDFHVLSKQLILFALIIVVFAFIPIDMMASYAIIVFGMMIPTSAMAYDEQSKWKKLASTMPYSARNLVLCKYVLGYIVLLFSFIIVLFAQFIVGVIIHNPIDSTFILMLLFNCCISTIIMSLSIPIGFRFGVDKIKYILLTVILVFTIASLILDNNLTEIIIGLSNNAYLVFLSMFIISIVANIISIFLSIKAWKAIN